MLGGKWAFFLFLNLAWTKILLKCLDIECWNASNPWNGSNSFAYSRRRWKFWFDTGWPRANFEFAYLICVKTLPYLVLFPLLGIAWHTKLLCFGYFWVSGLLLVHLPLFPLSNYVVSGQYDFLMPRLLFLLLIIIFILIKPCSF